MSLLNNFFLLIFMKNIIFFIDISISWFYKYIRIYQTISMDILTQNIDKTEINQNSEKYLE